MSPEVTAILAALACAVVGTVVPLVVERIPEPPAETEGPGDDADVEPRPTYAEVAARPGLALQTTILSGIGGGVVGWFVGWDLFLAGLLPLVPVCVGLAIVDLHTHLLPKVVVLPATALVLLGGAADAVAAGDSGDSGDLVRGLIGMVAARSVYWLLWYVHSAGMGFGDVRLAALLGYPLAHLGWSEFAVGMYSGFLVFAVPGVVLALVRRDRSLLRAPYPFGPAMIVGALLGVVVGPAVVGSLVGG